MVLNIIYSNALAPMKNRNDSLWIGFKSESKVDIVLSRGDRSL